jgi:hypothetical protein
MTELVDYIESQIKLDLDEVYGHLNCKPLNSGCSFELRLKFEGEDFNSYKKIAEKVDLDSSKLISKSFEIYNRNKINLSSSGVLKNFVEFFSSLLK